MHSKTPHSEGDRSTTDLRLRLPSEIQVETIRRSFESITRLILTKSELNTHVEAVEDLDWGHRWLEARLGSGLIEVSVMPQMPERPALTSWR